MRAKQRDRLTRRTNRSHKSNENFHSTGIVCVGAKRGKVTFVQSSAVKIEKKRRGGKKEWSRGVVVKDLVLMWSIGMKRVMMSIYLVVLSLSPRRSQRSTIGIRLRIFLFSSTFPTLSSPAKDAASSRVPLGFSAPIAVRNSRMVAAECVCRVLSYMILVWSTVQISRSVASNWVWSLPFDILFVPRSVWSASLTLVLAFHILRLSLFSCFSLSRLVFILRLFSHRTTRLYLQWDPSKMKTIGTKRSRSH